MQTEQEPAGQASADSPPTRTPKGGLIVSNMNDDGPAQATPKRARKPLPEAWRRPDSGDSIASAAEAIAETLDQIADLPLEYRVQLIDQVMRRAMAEKAKKPRQPGGRTESKKARVKAIYVALCDGLGKEPRPKKRAIEFVRRVLECEGVVIDDDTVKKYLKPDS